MQISRRDMMLGLASSGVGVAVSGIGLAGSAWAGSHISKGHISKGHISRGWAFGSFWRLVTADAKMARVAKSVVDAVVDEVTHRMSPYEPTSELSRFNTAKTSDWLSMSGPSCTVVAEALRIARVSGGAFDPTVGPLVAQFGFGPIRGAVGRYDDIVVAPGAIRKQVPGLTLDLCGIAKGYALDQVAAGLTQAGVEDALIEIGGEVRALGMHPNGRVWKIGIADPLSNGAAVQRVVKPGVLALATSGHAVNGVRDPVNISHIVNPNSGRPAHMTLASVSVLAASGMEADALATALCAHGARAGIDLAERLGISALFVTDGSEAPLEVMTGGFDTHIEI